MENTVNKWTLVTLCYLGFICLTVFKFPARCQFWYNLTSWVWCISWCISWDITFGKISCLIQQQVQRGGGTSWSFVMLYLLFIHLSVGWQFSKKLESPFNFEFIAPMKTKLKINRKVFCFFICRFQAQQWQQKKKKSNYVGIPNGILKLVISWNDSSCIQGCILILCPINIVLIFMMLPYK